MIKTLLIFVVWGLTYGSYSDVSTSKAPHCDPTELPILAFNVTDGPGELWLTDTDKNIVLNQFPITKNGEYRGCIPRSIAESITISFVPR